MFFKTTDRLQIDLNQYNQTIQTIGTLLPIRLSSRFL